MSFQRDLTGSSNLYANVILNTNVCASSVSTINLSATNASFTNITTNTWTAGNVSTPNVIATNAYFSNLNISSWNGSTITVSQIYVSNQTASRIDVINLSTLQTINGATALRIQNNGGLVVKDRDTSDPALIQLNYASTPSIETYGLYLEANKAYGRIGAGENCSLQFYADTVLQAENTSTTGWRFYTSLNSSYRTNFSSVSVSNLSATTITTSILNCSTFVADNFSVSILTTPNISCQNLSVALGFTTQGIVTQNGVLFRDNTSVPLYFNVHPTTSVSNNSQIAFDGYKIDEFVFTTRDGTEALNISKNYLSAVSSAFNVSSVSVRTISATSISANNISTVTEISTSLMNASYINVRDPSGNVAGSFYESGNKLFIQSNSANTSGMFITRGSNVIFDINTSGVNLTSNFYAGATGPMYVSSGYFSGLSVSTFNPTNISVTNASLTTFTGTNGSVTNMSIRNLTNLSSISTSTGIMVRCNGMALRDDNTSGTAYFALNYDSPALATEIYGLILETDATDGAVITTNDEIPLTFKIENDTQLTNSSTSGWTFYTSVNNACQTNLSNVSCVNLSLTTITGNTINISNASFINVSSTSITATSIRATSIDSSTINTSTLNSCNASFTNLSTTTLSLGTLSVSNFSVSNISATNQTITNLSVSNLSVSNISSTTITGTTINTSTLYASNVSFTNISGSSLTLTTIKVSNLSVSNISATNQTITNLSVSNLSTTNISSTTITGTTINAPTINTSTLYASNVSFTNISGSSLTLTTINVSNLSVSNISAISQTITNLSVSNISATNMSITGISAANITSTSTSFTFMRAINASLTNSLTVGGTLNVTSTMAANSLDIVTNVFVSNQINVSSVSTRQVSSTSMYASYISMINSSFTTATGSTLSVSTLNVSSFSPANMSLTNISVSGNATIRTCSVSDLNASIVWITSGNNSSAGYLNQTGSYVFLASFAPQTTRVALTNGGSIRLEATSVGVSSYVPFYVSTGNFCNIAVSGTVSALVMSCSTLNVSTFPSTIRTTTLNASNVNGSNSNFSNLSVDNASITTFTATSCYVSNMSVSRATITDIYDTFNLSSTGTLTFKNDGMFVTSAYASVGGVPYLQFNYWENTSSTLNQGWTMYSDEPRGSVMDGGVLPLVLRQNDVVQASVSTTSGWIFSNTINTSYQTNMSKLSVSNLSVVNTNISNLNISKINNSFNISTTTSPLTIFSVSNTTGTGIRVPNYIDGQDLTSGFTIGYNQTAGFINCCRATRFYGNILTDDNLNTITDTATLGIGNNITTGGIRIGNTTMSGNISIDTAGDVIFGCDRRSTWNTSDLIKNSTQLGSFYQQTAVVSNTKTNTGQTFVFSPNNANTSLNTVPVGLYLVSGTVYARTQAAYNASVTSFNIGTCYGNTYNFTQGSTTRFAHQALAAMNTSGTTDEYWTMSFTGVVNMSVTGNYIGVFASVTSAQAATVGSIFFGIQSATVTKIA